MKRQKGVLWLVILLLLTVTPAQVVLPQERPAGEKTAEQEPGALLPELREALSPYLQTHDIPPIVLVHGWQGFNFDKPDCERPTDPQWADDLWDHFDEDLEAMGFHVGFALLKSGSSFDEPNCTPIAEENAPYLLEAIDQALAATGQSRVILIAHSMGGLVSRAYLESDLYRGDVAALFTLGTPHVGVPVDVLAELVELLTFGALTLEEYCIAQPVVCQFSDNEEANPPGFTGIETFNEIHNTRAAGVYYHMIGGDIGFDDRGWLAEILYQLIPGPNDGIVPLPSAMAVSSADDGSGPPLPRLGPLSGVIDRLEVYAAHIDSFCDDPSVPFTCDYHYHYHDYDRFCADWDLTVYLDEEFRSSSMRSCLEPVLANRLPTHICGTAEDLTQPPAQRPSFPAPTRLRGRIPSVWGTLPAGGRAVRTVHLDGGPALLFAHGPLQPTPGRLSVTLVDPAGQVIDSAYAQAYPGKVRYKGDERAGLYILARPTSGDWQIVVRAEDAAMPYRTAGLLLEGQALLLPASPPLSRRPAGPTAPARPDLHQAAHTCTIDHPGPYLPGDTVHLSFELQTGDEGTYVEWLDGYFLDAPDAWAFQSQSPPPDDDLGGWSRTTAITTCNESALAYWGIEAPYLAPLSDTCDLNLLDLPWGGSLNGPWATSEWYDVTTVEGFEGAFPPTGWALYKTGGGSDNHGFQQTSTRVHSGNYSAFHDDDDPWPWDPIETWLVMPAHTVQGGDVLAFWQNENYESYYTYHGVWVSTGSPDPNDGDFVEGIELGPGQEDTWEEVWLDLSWFSGKTVYLAFKYAGDYSDEWYLDDISIKRLRLAPATYTFAATFQVAPDSPYHCPGSPYVGLTSWYTDTRAGLVGVAMGDLVSPTLNLTTCDVAQPCPLPALSLSTTLSLDGSCPGRPAVEVPANLQTTTLCLEVLNTSPAVTVTTHTLDVPLLGGRLLSMTLPLGPGEAYAWQRDWDPQGQEGQCFTLTATWAATTTPGLGQPQGAGADLPFITTTYATGASGQAGLCVVAPLVVGLSGAAYTVTEGGGPALLTVTLSAPFARPAAVSYATADGTARAGQDYLSATGRLTFAPGTTVQTCTIPLLDDALDEADETVLLALSDPQNALIGDGEALLTILDDDRPAFWIYLPLVKRNSAP